MSDTTDFDQKLNEILVRLWESVEVEDVMEQLIDVGAISDAAEAIKSLVERKS